MEANEDDYTIVLDLMKSGICSFSFTSSYPSCSGAKAPGLAADMHFKNDVIAFVGPACAFALEPVARLAAYWNSPIITGMGDQVSTARHKSIDLKGCIDGWLALSSLSIFDLYGIKGIRYGS